MSQLLRGIAWRKGQAFTLFILGTVVVAGSLVAARFSDLTGTPAGSVGILLVLGVVALAVQAAGSARSRRPEIALAQIRGRHGARVFAYFLAEPVTILLLATAGGVLLGRWVTRLAADRWLQVSSAQAQHIDTLGWWTVGIALTASVGAVVAGSWRTVREPLVEQLDASHRPRPSGTLVLSGQTLVLVVAAVAGYQATQNAGSRDGWAGIVNPALLSPVLLGLAAGQVAAWALQAAAALASRRSREPRRIGMFLAVRRLARRSDTVFGTRLVIAAAVVTAVTTSATTAVDGWQDEATRLSLGGPRQYPVESGALAAYQSSRAADPDGRWLMAMVAAPDESDPYRRVFADTERWNAVVGDFLDDTGASSVGSKLDTLDVGRPVHPARGDRVTVSFDNASLVTARQATVTVLYTSLAGEVPSAVITPSRPTTSKGTTRASARLDGCEDGCTAVQLVVEGYPARRRNTHLVITDLDFAGQQVLEETRWDTKAANGFTEVRQRAGTLRILLTQDFGFGGQITLKPIEAVQQLAALMTPGLSLRVDKRRPIAYSVDGSEHPVIQAGSVTALPFVGRRGMLLDLRRALAGASSTIPTAAAFVLARADTPASVLDDLVATGLVGDPREFDASLDRAQRQPAVQGARLYTLMSAFAALIALVGLAAALSGQRGERQREAASLRVTGVRARHIRSAHRREALWLSVCAAVAVALTGWLAARLTLEGLALVPQTAYTPTLEGDPSLPTLAIVALGAGVLVGLVTLGMNRRVARSSPPSMLRDEVIG